MFICFKFIRSYDQKSIWSKLIWSITMMFWPQGRKWQCVTHWYWFHTSSNQHQPHQIIFQFLKQFGNFMCTKNLLRDFLYQTNRWMNWRRCLLLYDCPWSIIIICLSRGRIYKETNHLVSVSDLILDFCIFGDHFFCNSSYNLNRETAMLSKWSSVTHWWVGLDGWLGGWWVVWRVSWRVGR